jgi:pimeloyl-ACP methyl ester carboxylesterase
MRGVQAAARLLPDLTPERFVAEMIRVCTVDPSRVSQEVMDVCLRITRERLTAMPQGVRAFVQASRSVTRFVLRPRRYLRIVQEAPARALVLLSSHDRLVPAHLAAPVMAARPDWHMRMLDGVGHMPQIEDPDAVAAAIAEWLDPRADVGGTIPA